MSDDFNIDDFLNNFSDSDDSDDDSIRDKVLEFQDKIKDEAMREAYRFIEEVGILFWIRQDMYVKNERKSRILNKMIEFFIESEEYEKCAYLTKGIQALADNKKSIQEETNL